MLQLAVRLLGIGLTVLCFCPLMSAAQADGPVAEAKAQSATAKSAVAQQKLRVVVGFYVNALHELDAQAQTFRADLYFWLRYRPRSGGLIDEELEEIRFVNGDIESSELEERKAIGAETYVLSRVRALFHFHADFRRYPFDAQHLPIEVQHAFLQASSLEIVPDAASYRRDGQAMRRAGLGDGLALVDMFITGVHHHIGRHTYRTDFGDPTDVASSTTFDRYSMIIETQREVWPFLFKIVIPLLIIQVLAYLVFYIAPDRIDVAVGLAVTSLLASIAFQISLSDSLPDIGYLTTADHIFHLSYFLIMVAMAQMVYAYNLFSEGQTERAIRLDRLSRIAYPIVFFVGVALITRF